jgi:Fe2+ or Zn2+ uptake regulation protein
MLSGHDDHEYLFCERCGAVRALEPAQLEPVRDQIRELSGYEARFAHFAIVGRCPDCRKS